MATSTLYGNYATSDDATFRNFVQHVITAFTAGGLVQTTDTGQINPTTVLNPTTANGIAGYAIFRFNDTKQSTHPLFIKVEFVHSGYINKGSLAYTIGKATDGAGNLSGIIRPRIVAGRGDSGTPAVGNWATLVSGGDGYFNFVPFTDATDGYANGMFLCIERSTNSDAIFVGSMSFAATAAGANGTYSYAAMSFEAFTYATATSNRGIYPVVVPYFINGAALSASTSLASGAIGPVFPIIGIAPSLPPMQLVDSLVYPGGDTPGSTFTVSLGGVARTYYPVPLNDQHNAFGISMAPNVPGSTGHGRRYIGLAIRWE